MVELIVVRLLHIAAALAAFGFVIFAICMPRAQPGAPRSGHVWFAALLRRWTLASAVVAFLTWLLWLAALAPLMSGLSRAEAWRWPILRSVLFETDFGPVWIARAGLLILLIVLLWRIRGLAARGTGYATTIAVSALSLALLAGVGHANREAGAMDLIHLGGDALHTLGAGAWLGGLPPLLCLLRRAAALPSDDIATAVRRFSDLALFAVALLVAGSAVNTWFMIPALSRLWSTLYGGMLAAKIGLLVLILVFAAHNRLVLVPRLQRGSGIVTARPAAAAALQHNIWIELAAGAVILVVVSAMGITSP